MTKCKGGCQMRAGGKTCKKCGCDMEDKEYEKGEKEMRSGGMACMKCGGKMHKSGGTVSSCMKCGGGKYTFGGKTGWSKKKVTDKYASGGIIDTGCPPGKIKDPFTGECVYPATSQDSSNVYNRYIELDKYYKDNKDYKIIGDVNFKENNGTNFTKYGRDDNDKPLTFKEKLDNDLAQFKYPFWHNGEEEVKKTITYYQGNEKHKRPLPETIYRKPQDPNKPYVIEQREAQSGTLNLNAPYGYYDTRIEPSGYKYYENETPNSIGEGDGSNVFYYDIAQKPYIERSPEEHIEFQNKYGNYGGSKTPYEPLIQTPDPGPMPKENSPYKTLNDIKYSPEDIEILGKIKGKGLWRGNYGWLNLTDEDKIKAYKRGSKFEDMPEKDKRGPGYYSFGGIIKSLNNTYNIGGEINPRCPPGYMWNGQTCVEATFVNDFGGETPDYRYYMMDQIPGINKKQNPIKYYEQGDPEGIKAKQMYSDSLALHHKTQSDVSNFQNYSLPNYQSIEKGSWTDLFGNTNQKIKPVGQFRSPRSSCNRDGVCIDVYPKPVQPIGFKNKSTPKTYEMNPKETVGYKISELTNTNNTSNDRKELARNIDFEKKTGRPYSGTIEDNVFLYDEVKKTIESRNKPTATPENKIEQEPVNTENTFNLINRETEQLPNKQNLIPTKDVYQKITAIPKGNETETDEEILGKLKGKGLWRGAAGWVPLSDQQKIDFYKRGAEFKDLPEKDVKGSGFYSFGGAIKSYTDGGKVARTGNKNVDLALTMNEMFKVMKAENDKKYTGVTSGGYKYYRDKDGIPVVQIPDSEIYYDEEGNYDDELMVKSSKVTNTLDSGKQGKASNAQLDYSLPNLGYAKLEQKKLNDLIQAEIKAGAKDLELLVEDDIIGKNTLSAMNRFEGKGYIRPEGFKDKWLKKYAEDYANGVRMKVPGVTAPLTPKVPGKETVKTTEIKAEEDQSYTKEDFYSDVLNTGKSALEYLFPSIKTAPIKIPKGTLPAEEKSTAKKAKQEQTKAKEESSFFPSMSDIMSGIQGGLTGAVDYSGKALEYITGEGGNYIRNAQAKDKIIKADLAKKAEEDRKKRIAYMKSDLNYGLEAAKGFGYDVLGGLGSAYEYATQLGEKGQKQKAEEERINSYKNFGKKSAKAAAESATERAKKLNVVQGYVPVKINPITPSENKEKLPLEKSTPSYIKNAKGQMIATDFMKDQKSKNLEKKLDEGSKNFLNIPLRKSNALEDVRHNSKVIGEHYNKIEKALDMLSGTGPTSMQGFIRMTTIPNRTVDPITRKVSKGFENVEGKEYEDLAIIHTFLEKELDKIHADPKYKDLDAHDKKTVLYNKLDNTAKKLIQRQNEIESQIK
jgi:hypothetical protein